MAQKCPAHLQRLTDFFQKKFKKIWSGRQSAVLLQPISLRKRGEGYKKMFFERLNQLM
jgi:hypothetical protein